MSRGPISRLLVVEESGLLEAYVLLAKLRQGIAQDFVAYRAAHADKLLSYLKTFVAPLEAQAK